MGCERKTAVKYDASVFGLSNWTESVGSPERGRLLKARVWGKIEIGS